MCQALGRDSLPQFPHLSRDHIDGPCFIGVDADMLIRETRNTGIAWPVRWVLKLSSQMGHTLPVLSFLVEF